REDGGGGRTPERDAVGFGAPVAEGAEVFDELGVEIGLLRREERGQRVVRGHRNGGLDRRVLGGSAKTRVALEAPDDSVHGVEHGDVDDGQGPTRASRPELLAEHAWVTGRDRRVVEAGGVEGESVPVAKAVRDSCAAVPPASRLTPVRASGEARPEG